MPRLLILALLSADLPALAQYPTQYPPGEYPPGQYRPASISQEDIRRPAIRRNMYQNTYPTRLPGGVPVNRLEHCDGCSATLVPGWAAFHVVDDNGGHGPLVAFQIEADPGDGIEDSGSGFPDRHPVGDKVRKR